MRFCHWVIYPISVLLLLLENTDGVPCGQLPTLNLLGQNVEASCDNNLTMIRLKDQYQNTISYQVISIDYHNRTIRLIDPGLMADNCSALPLYRTTYTTLSYQVEGETRQVVLEECPFPLPRSSYISTSPCISSTPGNYTYAALSSSGEFFLENCRVLASTIAQIGECVNCSYAEIHQSMLRGFDVPYYPESWSCEGRSRLSFLCILRAAVVGIIDAFPTLGRVVEWFLIARSSIGVLILLVLIAYKLLRRHLSTDESIEEFLQQYKNNIPKTYSYWQILKMTKNFKEKLGKGGFGSVYKGKLPSGQLVAVKMLSDSMGNGQDFINEVSTIGRIHHTNIVQLVGFCSAGARRALIYQYMPNGSLDKHIFSTEEGHSLSWDQIYHIAIGIARGIQYLHQGCDVKILHFDIKPHNVLLNETLTPKLSDFGLAKHYSTDQSVVSVTAARGTFGYMAPELIYRSSAGVSTKSDVYSYGMLLMEMAGKRKNVNPTAKTSQVYFPSWIYEKLVEEEEVGIILGASEGEEEVVKKLLIVGLWCIQMKPSNRPSMTKVVELLEGSVDVLQMPPKPFFSSPERNDDSNFVMDTSSLVIDEPTSSHSFL